MLSATTGALLRKNPIFRRFLAASGVSLLGSSVFDIAMPLYVLEKTHSPIALATVSLGLTLPYFLMAPITGFLADHWEKRRVMVAADLGQVLCMAALLIHESSQSESLWPIFLAVFFAKTFMTLFETVSTFQLIPSLVERSELSAATGSFLTTYRFIQILGPLVGGALMTVSGIQSCIVVNLISFGSTLYFVYSARHLSQMTNNDATPSPSLTLRNVWINFWESASYVWRSKLFRPFIFLMFLWNLSSLCPSTPSLTFYFRETHGYTPAEYGLIAGLIGFFGIIGFLLAGRWYEKKGFASVLFISSIWQAILASLSLLFVQTPLALAVVFSISRISASTLSMGTFLLRQTEVPTQRLGGANAALRMFFMSAAPLSAMLQGYAIRHFGITVTLMAGAFALWGSSYFARKTAIAYQLLHPTIPTRQREVA